MPHTIALAGKGGVGKTTITGMLIEYLIDKKKTPILAVDADANSNLNEVLGVKVDMTLGDIREEIERSESSKDNPIPAGVTKADYAEQKFNQALVEDDDFDLLVMGRTQGKGCYCFVNGLLQNEIQKIQGNYKYLVVDNEAGMEHISRGTIPAVNCLILVSDCSRRGIQAAARIAELSEELKIRPEKMVLIVNRVPDGVLNDGITEEIEKHNLELAGVIPNDNMIYEYDSTGRPTAFLPESSQARKALDSIIEKIL